MIERSRAPDFTNIETWVFDLDNTLYPSSCDLFAQVDERMTAYIRALLHISYEDARKIRQDFYRDYGTTLRGLMDCYQIDPDDFLNKVHDIDYSCLAPQPALADALERRQGRKIIFTNGSRDHAENALAQLGLTHIFEEIFDIKAAGYVPKPQHSPYEQFLRDFNLDPYRAAMFEDLDRNLEVPHALGLRTVLVVPPYQVRPTGHYIDFVTDNLSHFLENLDMS